MNAVELTTGPIFPGIPCEPCFPFLPCKKIDYNSINLKLHIFNFLENVHSELLTSSLKLPLPLVKEATNQHLLFSVQ